MSTPAWAEAEAAFSQKNYAKALEGFQVWRLVRSEFVWLMLRP
jgi:hypothetical protein